MLNTMMENEGIEIAKLVFSFSMIVFNMIKLLVVFFIMVRIYRVPSTSLLTYKPSIINICGLHILLHFSIIRKTPFMS